LYKHQTAHLAKAGRNVGLPVPGSVSSGPSRFSGQNQVTGEMKQVAVEEN